MSGADLLSLPYSGPRAAMTAKDFTSQLHGPMGKAVRWFKAFEVPPGTANRTKQGFLFDEQTLPADFRVLIGSTNRDTVAVDGTLLPKGTMTISNDVGVMELARRDRLVITDISWLARQMVTRGSGTTDALVHPYVNSIQTVLVGGEVVDSDEYEAADNGIVWDVGAGPDAGTPYSIEYRYHPLVEYLLQEDNLMQVGGDSLPLPQRGFGRVVLPTKD